MKLGSDAVGTVMGLLTIPMAALSIASIAAGLALVVWQDWAAILFGLAACVLGSVLAWLLERVVIATDDAAATALADGRRRIAHAVALVSGVLPVAVIFAAEIACLRGVMDRASAGPAWLGWLWGYGVATGPWTLFAQRVSRFRRSLVGLRAYAGHVALWLFSALVLWLHAPAVVLGVALVVIALPPVTIGLLLALADREAIANVRV